MTTTETSATPSQDQGSLGRLQMLGDPLIDDSPDTLGGKGASLHAMLLDGIPVPPAFCIPPGWDIDAPDAMLDLLEARRSLDCDEVAVRSSATTEDARTASSAGMHDTFLCIGTDEELIEAVRACRRSLHSRRAEAYGVAGESAGMAVVVQAMVDADAAGVCFTTHPVDPSHDGMVVEAAFGLGKAVVDGEVVCDSYTLAPENGEVTERRIREKTLMRSPSPEGGTTLTKVPVERRTLPTLTDHHLAQLHTVSGLLRERMGSEVDVEFATQGDRVYFLQCRPVTTPVEHTPPLSPYLEEVDERLLNGTLWSRMDIGEIFTGTMTPLGLSFARYYQDHVHLDCAAALGVRDRGDVALQMGYLGGQVYLNISYSAQLLQQAPPTRDQIYFTRRFMSEEVGASSYRNPFGRFVSDSNNIKETAYWAASTLRELGVMERRARDMVRSRHQETDRALAIDLTSLDREGLLHEMTRHLAYFHDMHVGYMPYYINAFGIYGLLDGLSQAWLPSSSEAVGRVKSDMSALRTIQTARDFAQLAEACENYPEAARIILDLAPNHAMPALRDDPAGQRFIADQLDPFLRNHGVRGRQEMELTNPRWLDDPSFVIGVVGRYLRNPEERARALRVREAHPAAEGMRGLSPLRRAALHALTKAYVRCSELRETTRMSMITSIWLVRRVVMEVARRAVAEGHLHGMEEVAFLDFHDVLGLLRGQIPPEDAFSRPALERRLHEHRRVLRSAVPPLSFVGTYDASRSARHATHDTDVIEGLGTAAGVVEGRARVIRDIALQADEFQAEEILVAPFTDASWTPLFAVAAGVVTDVGSMLSHSSIVAREFGLASVVNTTVATSAIRTGDLIRVDGSRGVVEILERAHDDHAHPEH